MDQYCKICGRKVEERTDIILTTLSLDRGWHTYWHLRKKPGTNFNVDGIEVRGYGSFCGLAGFDVVQPGTVSP